MIEFLSKNPLLLLFLTAAIGYAIGRIKIKGASLGVAAVLFVGLFIGSFSPELRIPDFAFTFGLAVFVYTIGLTSGAGFFASFTRKGLRDNVFIFTMLLLAFGFVLLSAGWFALKPTIAAGIFAGSMTNTPALAGVLDVLRSKTAADLLEATLAEPVVGYSVTYPMGVLGPILAILLMTRIFGIDYRREAARLKDFNLVDQEIYNVTVKVAAGDATTVTLHEFTRLHRPNVVFGRIQRGDVISLADGATQLVPGDLVSIVGGPEDVDAAAAAIGTVVDDHLDFDRSQYDFRRMFVSHNAVVGRRIGDLMLPEKFDSIITRVRRGDADFLASASTVLELGDRVRVVAPRSRMKEVGEFFGDSYKELSEIDLLSFGLGMSLGLLLGLVPIPLPGGVTITLGSAGGPLLVALVLGALRRTGPIVWTLPYSANLTLRQLGLILLLTTVGLKSGYTFVSTFAQSGGAVIFFVGMAISVALPLLALVVGYRVLKIPFGMLTGMVASMHTQPAVLGFAAEQSNDEAPNIGWSLVYPLATISKIILAQLILSILTRSGG